MAPVPKGRSLKETAVFEPAQLRSFLAVAETLSFTKAAERLGLAQPTVSQHVRKLETAAKRLLVRRDTRDVRLTDNGDAMAGFARNILSAHDAAARYFSGSAMRGRLRFGTADDLAITGLPRILREFRQIYPQINLELTVGQSDQLYKKLNAGQLDLVFVKWVAGAKDGTVVQHDTFSWVGLEQTSLKPADPVPLIAYPSPSLSRKLATRYTCTSRRGSSSVAAASYHRNGKNGHVRTCTASVRKRTAWTASRLRSTSANSPGRTWSTATTLNMKTTPCCCVGTLRNRGNCN
jgi:DNA-binding transcriptional LysR family regulator